MDAAQEFDIDGDYAYVGTVGGDLGGLVILDISTPPHINMVGFCWEIRSLRNVNAEGNVACGYTMNRLFVINVSDPTNPFVAETFDFDEEIKDVDMADGFAYVALGYQGVYQIDVSDPDAPEIAGFYNTPGIASDVHVFQNYILVADEINFGVYRNTLVNVEEDTHDNFPNNLSLFSAFLFYSF